MGIKDSTYQGNKNCGKHCSLWQLTWHPDPVPEANLEQASKRLTAIYITEKYSVCLHVVVSQYQLLSACHATCDAQTLTQSNSNAQLWRAFK